MRVLAASRALAASLALTAAVAGCGGDSTGATGPSRGSTASAFDAERAFSDLRAQVEIGPRPSGTPAARRTAQLIVAALSDAGVSRVRIQRPYANVVGTIPGSAPGTVVVGAHYDTKSRIPGFVGANDGASGVAVLLELARALPNPLPGPAVQLVFFDAEEARDDRSFESDGTRGSNQYVAYARRGEQGSVAIDRIRAMVLFDMVGDCDLQIPLERFSDPSLYRRFADAATSLDGTPAPFQGRGFPIEDDHLPFAQAGIPALDLIDFDYGPGPPPGAYWHTPKDTIDHVCAQSLELVGEAALIAIPEIR